jgi:hypothetical protein
MKNSCAIVIPVYKPTLSIFEAIALEQCKKILAEYDIVIIKPNNLDISTLNVDLPSSSKAISFDDHYFRSVHDYNNLMLSSAFYHQFLNYEYILLHQLDAFVFKNDLEYWCNTGYDYIGAPWLPERKLGRFKSAKESIRSFLHKKYNFKDKDGLIDTGRQVFKAVGNGGLSLRRVQKFYQICIEHHRLVDTYKNKTTSHFNEDIFWSIEINRKTKLLKIPGYKQAVLFSMETAPEMAMNLTNNRLPFGCHAWDKKLDFWRPYFQESGFVI